MKKHISVFMLMVRYSFYRVLGLLAVMATVEAGLFWMTLKRGFSQEGYGLEYVIDKSHIAFVFFIAFVIMDIFLISFAGYEKMETHRYTLMRLSVTRKEVYYLQSIYNMLCYLLFWAMQILIVILLGYLYVKNAPAEYVTGQTIFFAFYRNSFLHSLLPFEDFPYWIRNILLCFALGFMSAMYITEESKPKIYGVFWGIAYTTFIGRLGDYGLCIILGIFAIACIMVEIHRINKKEKEEIAERMAEDSEVGSGNS